jgi:hypothetical protein
MDGDTEKNHAGRHGKVLLASSSLNQMAVTMQTESPRDVVPGLAQRAQAYFLLMALLLVLVFNNTVWLWLDRTPLTWDEAHHLSSSVDYYRWLWGPASARAQKFYEISPYPPMVGLLTQLIFPFFGFNADAAILFVQSLFALVLMLAMFGIVNILCSDRDAGLLASLLIFLYPATFVLSRHYILDLPLAAMSALSMFLLLRLDRSWSRRDAAWFGLALGLGMLTKWTFAFYLTVPTLIVIVKMLSKNPSKPRLVHAVLTFGIALLVAAPWYVGRFISFLPQIPWYYGWAAHRNDLLWTQLGGLFFYPVNLVLYQVSPVGFVFFLLGAIFFLKPGGNLARWLIAAWVMAPMIILTLIRYKSPRYALPYLPAMALVTVVGLYEMKRRVLRVSLLMAFIILLLVQYYALSFGLFSSPEIGPVKLFQPQYVENFSAAPRREDWKLDALLDQLVQAFDTLPEKNRAVFVLSFHEIYNANTLNYLSKIRNLGIRFIGAEYTVDPVGALAGLDTPYILLKESSPDEFFDANRARIVQATHLIRSQPSRYIHIYSQSLPDGSLVALYGKS